MCYLNKYIIKSINSTDSIQARNVKLILYVDWVGEINNTRELWVCSVNLNILIPSLLWINSSILNVPLQLELKISVSRFLKLEFPPLSLK